VSPQKAEREQSRPRESRNPATALLDELRSSRSRRVLTRPRSGVTRRAEKEQSFDLNVTMLGGCRGSKRLHLAAGLSVTAPAFHPKSPVSAPLPWKPRWIPNCRSCACHVPPGSAKRLGQTAGYIFDPDAPLEVLASCLLQRWIWSRLATPGGRRG
jgi:hypothetical protein